MKYFFRAIGYVITALSLLYIITIFFRSDLHALQFGNPMVSSLYVLLFGFWASIFVVIGAFNWKLILDFLNGGSLLTKDVFKVYLKSNIAKYLPGNVMHYAGRNYLGNKLGWNNTEMAFSSVLEYFFGFGLTGIIIVMLIALGLIDLPPQLSLEINFNKILGYSLMGIAGCLVFLSLFYSYRYILLKEDIIVTTKKLWNKAQQFLTLRFLKLFSILFIISFFCFIMNCMFFYYLCGVILDFHIKPEDFFNANAALSIANYTSILTPGAPGGIGVKESVSVLLIAEYGYPKELLLMSLLVFRVTCVLGDVIPFFVIKLFPGFFRS
jgi:hypothetical protein